MTLVERIAGRIRREGPISFADFQAMALYDEVDGFFASSGGAGRMGADFVTSPEVGTLFGALVARHLDEVWRRLGSPDPFMVIEAGAGRGRLATDVLRADPECAPALRYVLVERSARLRAAQREHLPLEPIDEALGPFAHRSDPDEPLEVVPHAGPIVSGLDDLPAMSIEGVVIANELLDNLPVHLVERSDGGWLEVRVGVDDDQPSEGGRFVEVVVPAPAELASEADHVAGGLDVPDGRRLPVPIAAREWLERVAMLLNRGEVLLVDYMDEARGLADRGQSAWLRTYAGHGRGATPLVALGRQDITCDVSLEHLRWAAGRAGFTVAGEVAQADWLRGLGIDELVAAGDEIWRERAHLGDLAAIAGRSRGVEAAALIDPTGLGAHRVVTLKRRIA